MSFFWSTIPLLDSKNIHRILSLKLFESFGVKRLVLSKHVILQRKWSVVVHLPVKLPLPVKVGTSWSCLLTFSKANAGPSHYRITSFMCDGERERAFFLENKNPMCYIRNLFLNDKVYACTESSYPREFIYSFVVVS